MPDEPQRTPKRGSGSEESRQLPLSVEYNLEKEPLATGRLAPRVDPATKAAMSPDEWTIRRRMAGWIAVWLMAIIITIGAIVLFDLHRWLARLVRFES